MLWIKATKCCFDHSHNRVDILSTRLSLSRKSWPACPCAHFDHSVRLSKERKVARNAPKFALVCSPHGYPPRASKHHTARSWGHTRELADILSVRCVGVRCAKKMYLHIYPFLRVFGTPLKNTSTYLAKKNRSFDNQISKSLSPHLIGQKSDNFTPLQPKVYILFTEFSPLYLHCRKNRPFDNHILRKFNLLTYMKKIGGLAPHLRQKDRRFFIFGLFC